MTSDESSIRPNENSIRVLLVEDNTADAEIVTIHLEEASGDAVTITRVARLSEAIEKLRCEPHDVVLLDLSLPDSRGIETVSRLRAEADRAAVVVMTGSLDERLSLEAADHGAEAFLVKGEAEGALLMRTLVYAIRQHRSRRELEEERRESEYRATHDALTRLPNRMLLMDRLQQAMQTASRTERVVGLLFVDLDHFKEVNDDLGHATGDALLQCVAERLTQHVRASDTVARLGGDEFVVLLTNVRRGEDVHILAEKLEQALSEPATLEGHDVTPGASIGAAVGPEDGASAAELLAAADAAMYRTKRSRRERDAEHTAPPPASQAPAQDTATTEQTSASDSNLEFHFAPEIDVEAGNLSGVEVIPMCPLPDGRMIPWSSSAAHEIERPSQTSAVLHGVFSLLERKVAESTLLKRAPRISLVLPERVLTHPELPERLESLRMQLERSAEHSAQLECRIPPTLLIARFRGELPTWVANAHAKLALDLGAAPSLDQLLLALRHFPVSCVHTPVDLAGPPGGSRIERATAACIAHLLEYLKIRWSVHDVDRESQAENLYDLGARHMRGALFVPAGSDREVSAELASGIGWVPSHKRAPEA